MLPTIDSPSEGNGIAGDPDTLSWWQPVLLAALAGGMGWGIRGQYGHETGAMIAGLLVGLVLVFLFCARAASLPAARAVAWCTVAIGFGGSMTYGQTIGLTHDASLIGDGAALCWGMLGLAIKGGIWIGFAGAFLGMGLGGVKYRPGELLLVMLGLLALFVLGVWVLNTPFDPASKLLPHLYFSDDWRWEPGADLKPRREVWGGLLCALAGHVTYAAGIRRDTLAGRLALWGVLGGAIGFPLGQSLQAFHAWHPEFFREGIWATLDPHMNWWNIMEITFGATFAAVLAFGVWLNRTRIAALEAPGQITLKPAFEWVLCGVHVFLLAAGEFLARSPADVYVEFSLLLGLVPVVAIAGGRWWPYLLVYPVTALPVAGKTLRQLVYREASISPTVGWLIYLVLPLALTTAAAIWFARRGRAGQTGREFSRATLLIVAWLYFGLNFAFFRFPWPWSEWTGRTPSGMIMAICVLGLTTAALFGASARDTVVSLDSK